MLLKQCEHSLFTPPLPPVALLSLHTLRTWVFWRVGPWWGLAVCRWNSVALDRWASLLHSWEIRAVKTHSSPLLATFPVSSTCLAHLYTHSLSCFPTHIARGCVWKLPEYEILVFSEIQWEGIISACFFCFVLFFTGEATMNRTLFCFVCLLYFEMVS